MKSQPQKTTLVVGVACGQRRLDACPDIESHFRQQDSILDDSQQPVLFHHEQSVAVAGCVNRVIRRGHVGGNWQQKNRDVAIRERGQIGSHCHMHGRRGRSGAEIVRRHGGQRMHTDPEPGRERPVARVDTPTRERVDATERHPGDPSEHVHLERFHPRRFHPPRSWSCGYPFTA